MDGRTQSAQDDAAASPQNPHGTLILPGRPSITLVRHGRPALDRSKYISYRQYRDWWAAYDEGGLAHDQSPPESLVKLAQNADVIYASTLRRAQETAQALAGDHAILSDPRLVEAPLPPPPFAGIRLRPGPWGVLARISWWFGASGNMESRKHAELRADEAVDMLIAAATSDGGQRVLVCAHGWINRMMRPVLLSRGWRCIVDGGDSYWSTRQFEPIK